MRKVLLTLFVGGAFFAHSQTVTTFGGKVNNDPYSNYESASGVELNNTFFSQPEGICFDANGKMYIAERNKIRIVLGTKTYNRVGSLASPTMSEGYTNATGTQAYFRQPHGMVSDADGNLYVADRENHCIRKVSKYVSLGNGQFVTTFAGANPNANYGTSGSTNGSGTAARFNQPTGITIDGNGNFYVTDYFNFTIRKITPSGTVSTLAGNAGNDGFSDGTGQTARFGGPWGIAMLDDNHLVVSDQWNTNIRKININTGAVTTIAGPTTGADSRIVDGTLTAARFKAPKGLAVVEGIIYVGDENVIRAIDVDNNTVTTFAGDKTAYSVKNGTGANANFTQISDITTDGFGNLFVTENSAVVGSSVIRKVVINGLAPVADFSAPKRSIIVNEKVVLSDISSGLTPTARTWTIDRTGYTVHTGDLTTKDVELSFNATGFYGVTLSITNEYGTDTKYTEAYFSVSNTGNVERYTASHLVNIYPNPATDHVTIDLDGSLRTPHTKVTLYHVNGQEVMDLTGIQVLNTSEIPNGSYFITVKNSEVSYAKRLVINN